LWDRQYSPQQLKDLISPDYGWYGTSNMYNNMRNWEEYLKMSESGQRPPYWDPPGQRITRSYWSNMRYFITL
jgi:hypothetical protein